jgi:hypothetical protein
MEHKYIIINGGALIFNKMHTHANVAQSVGTPTSAGFCDIDHLRKEVVAFGKSTSLDIESAKGDSAILTRFVFGRIQNNA